MLSLGEGIRSDARAATNIIGFVLLVGMVIVAAFILVMYGGQTIEETESDARMKAAQQSLVQVDERLSDLSAGGDSESVQFDLPDGSQGSIQMDHSTQIEVRAITPTTECTTGDLDIGTITYRNDDGDLVGYEGGGVWRKNVDGAATVVAAPGISYRDGVIELSLANMSGPLSQSDQVSARLQRGDSEIMREWTNTALTYQGLTVPELREYYEEDENDDGNPIEQSEFGPLADADGDGNPIETGAPYNDNPVKCTSDPVEQVRVSVKNSEFAHGWHYYAETNYDTDKRVTLDPEPNENVGPGDTVSMTFELGDVSSAEFEVTDVDAPSGMTASSSETVEATLENVGGLEGATSADLKLYKDTNPSPNRENWALVSQSVDTASTGTVDSGDTEDVPLEITGSDLSLDHDPQKYRYTVDTGDDTQSGTFWVGGSTAPASDYQITGYNAPDEVDPSDDPTLTVDVDNMGNIQDSREVTFQFDNDGDGDYTDDVSATRTVDLAAHNPSGSSDETQLTFDLPTDRQGNALEYTVTTGDDSITDTINIGDPPVFEVTNVDAPTQVDKGDVVTIQADIENTGERAGTENVYFQFRNASQTGSQANAIIEEGTTPVDESQSVTLDGTMTGSSGSTTLAFDVDTSMTDSVRDSCSCSYRNFTIWTPDDTAKGNLMVGDVATGTAQVVSVDADPSRIQQNESFDVDTTIANIGGAEANPRVEFRFDGVTEEVLFPDIAAGDTWSPDTEVEVDVGDIPPGWYSYTVDAGESSLTRRVHVQENVTGDAISDNTGRNTIRVNEDITARLTIEGTALTGTSLGSYELIRTPITASIYTENDSVGTQRHYMWGPDTDLNTPRMRQQQVDDDPALSQSINVSAGTTLSVYATSWYCGQYVDVWWSWQPRWQSYWQETDIDRSVYFPGLGEAYTLDSQRCGRRMDERIEINSNSNSGNVVVLEDGDEMPGYQEANPDQRSVNDMLGDRIEGDTLNLAEDERVFVYELSERNANPNNPDTSGGVDYNDAVVLFEVINHTRTIEQQSPSNLRITGSTAPATMGLSETDHFEVNVTNLGDRTGSRGLNFYIDTDPSKDTSFDTATTNAGPIDGNSYEEIFAPIGSDWDSQGVYTLKANLTNSSYTVTRNVFVGSATKPFFQVQMDDPGNVRPGNRFTLDPVVQNIGSEAGTQDVTATVIAGQNLVSTTQKTWNAVQLDPGEEKDDTFEFQTVADDTGTVRVRVETENASITTSVQVTESRFDIEYARFGTELNRDGDTSDNEFGVAVGSMDSLNAMIRNTATLSGQKDVTMTVTTPDGTETYEPESGTPLSLDGGGQEEVTFDVEDEDWTEESGTYDYTIETPNDTLDGQIVVSTQTTTTSGSSSGTDLITVDMNQITIGST